MFKYLFIEQLRGWKALIKHSYLVIIGIIVAFTMAASLVGNSVVSIRAACNDHITLISAALILICFFHIFFKNDPGITIKPALFHYLFNSAVFKNVKRYMILKVILKDIIIAMITGFVLFGFSFYAVKKAAFLTVFFLSSSAIKWLQYNNFDTLKSILLFGATSIGLFFSECYIVLLAELLFCCFTCCLATKIKPDWGKFNDSIILAERIAAAGRHMRVAEMTQITTEKVAKGKNHLKLTSMHMDNKNAVMYKASIGTFRSIKKLFFFWGIMATVSVIIIKFPYLTDKIFFGYKNISYLVSAYILSGLYIGVIRSVYDQFRSFTDKHKNGFFIPYPHKKIMMDYLLVCITLLTFISVIMGTAMSLGVIKTLISSFLIDTASLLLFYIMEIKKISKYRNVIVIAFNLMIAFFLYKLF